MVFLFLLTACLVIQAHAVMMVNDTLNRLDISNDRLTFSVNKQTGEMDLLTLDGQDLLGRRIEEEPIPGGPTGNGVSGLGPYLDCNCVLEGKGFYTPGRNASYRVFRGKDDDEDQAYGGFSMTDRHPKSGQLMQFFVFLRERETGLYTWSRVAYTKSEGITGPTRPVLQELRTLFRPNTDLWTHLVTNPTTMAPLPLKNNLRAAKFVQDATLDLSPFPDDPYVKETNPYFTKYSFADTWKDHQAHGLFGDGSRVGNGTWGAWLVMNQENYYGGPLHTDLTVDGIVYDYFVSNHYGANIPALTDGFDRIFGPNYYLFTHHSPNTSWKTVYDEARSFVMSTSFLDEAAKHVKGYVPPGDRVDFRAQVSLPQQVSKAYLVLSASGLDVQDNAFAPHAFQYWRAVSPKGGGVRIKDVVPGTYRVTLYADGVFGQWTQDNVEVKEGAPMFVARWTEETHGRELWRIGTPDHSSGEFRHGNMIDKAHTKGLQEYRIFYGAFDFTKDFPNGVVYHVGRSRPERDWNYVQWSNMLSSNWRVIWPMTRESFKRGSNATLTVQAAGVRTSVGNEHVPSVANAQNANLTVKAAVNGKSIGIWTIPYTQSSSCAVRSGVTCYNTRHKFIFDTDILREGNNTLTLTLPSGQGGHTGKSNLPSAAYLQYDALRLETVQEGL